LNCRDLEIPHVDFGGGVTTESLFAAKEQPIFDFYEAAGKAKRYLRALDIGANIGVHSILMARQDWTVLAYEPDPIHFAMWEKNVAQNVSEAYAGINGRQAAVSDYRGTATFVRVKGNTTGSHLKGDKQPYGELEEFQVEVVDCRPLFKWADFAKIDCEGHEARLLQTVTPETSCEFMVEVGSQKNAEAIFGHFHGWRGMWSQQSGWKPVTALGEMPMHHSQGALFIGKEPPFK
jgi:FkbM family methyltransferase